MSLKNSEKQIFDFSGELARLNNSFNFFQKTVKI